MKIKIFYTFIVFAMIAGVPLMSDDSVNKSPSDKREYRDMLLKESDWTQFGDSPLSDSKKTEWATYRQSLRDLPTQSGFPNVDMPTKPGS